MATVWFEAVGKASGAKVGSHTANVWEVRNGLITGFTGYLTVDEAL